MKKGKIKEEHKKILKYVWVISSIIIVLVSFYGVYKYGYFMGILEGAYECGGNEFVCSLVDKPLEENGYCLLADQRIALEPAFKHYIDCSWGEFTVISNYENKYLDWRPSLLLLKCKRTKLEEINGYVRQTIVAG